MSRHYILVLGLLIVTSILHSQPTDDKKAAFYTGVSPLVLNDRGLEVALNNSLASYWIEVSQLNPADNSTRIAERYRFSSIDHLLRLSYGFSRNGRWDLGIELGYTHRLLDDEARASPFRALGSDAETAIIQASGMSLIGLRARVTPIASLPEFTVQGTFHIPGTRDEEESQLLGFNRNEAGLSLNFYQQFNPYTFYFVQADWRSRLRDNENGLRAVHFPSVSGFLVFDLSGSQRWYVFPGISYLASLQKSGNRLRRISQQLHGSLGILFQPDGRFGILLNGQLPFIFESGNTLTEYVRESYTGFTLGFRYLLN
ncbi:MAG: hypothetical protein AAFU67_10615 [Bacteroidota bacterium]